VSEAKDSITDQSLIESALAARDHAYAPYSNYKVGCVLVAGGEVFIGANVENASYGLAICAERSAVAQAVFNGKTRFDIVVVATESSPPAAPCGMCLQTLHEFAGDPSHMRVILVNPQGERADFTLQDLFPRGFSKGQLPGHD
jgi:cytidine deaminase